MQAAVYHPGSPTLWVVDNYDIPIPTSNQVLLKVKACGVCHSDVFFLSQFASDTRSYIMGHEICGVIAGYGVKVDKRKFQEGKLYNVLSFGSCASALPKPSSNINITNFDFIGLGLNGGYAQYVAVDQHLLVPVPDNIPPEHAAVMADAGVTAFRAVHRTAQVKKGEKVLVIGIGGLGLLAVQIAKHFGAEVYALDIRPSSRALAVDFGATEAFDLEELSARTAKGFTVDAVVDFVSTSVTFAAGVSAIQNKIITTDLASGGRIVLVGVSDENLIVNAVQFISSNIAVLTSLYGSREDLTELLELVSKGAIKPVVEGVPLVKVNEVLNELRANLVLSRKVVVPPDSA
ncbi:GroES-like protein [Amylocystis lapponica]|nr:GroES-like protein [Amylocystis lapponica]